MEFVCNIARGAHIHTYVYCHDCSLSIDCGLWLVRLVSMFMLHTESCMEPDINLGELDSNAIDKALDTVYMPHLRIVYTLYISSDVVPLCCSTYLRYIPYSF